MSPECVLDRQAANDIIYDAVVSRKPLMLSRFGSIELSCVITYMLQHSDKSLWRMMYEYVTDNTELPWWDKLFFFPICNNAGVFPATTEILSRFAARYLEDLPLIDILMSIYYKEKWLPLSPGVKNIHFETSYPFFVEHPWTRALLGRKVLIVHPYEDTIRRQYEKRGLLFEDPDILPDFELKTLRSVQSACGAKTEFPDWFAALKSMEDKISEIDFDIAILGCGAYGLPLAAHIKRMGRQAIHLGGGTQLLFGIKGRRWEENYVWKYPTPVKLDLNYKDLFNEHWVRPSREETPQNAQRVEDGCYW